MTRETRIFHAGELRVAKREDGKTVIRGYSAKFNSMSEEMWGFREQIAPGAFSDAIKTDDVRALFNHDANFVLGRTPRTLTLVEDETGLLMEAEPPDTSAARDVITLIERGDVSGQSFTFSMDYGDDAAETWDYQGDTVTRTIRKISRLWDVGPVVFPAYPDTTAVVAQRSMPPPEVLERMAAAKAALREGRDIDTLRRRLRLIGR